MGSIEALLGLDCEQRPLARYTLEGPLAARFELDVRSSHEQWDDTRHPDVTIVGVIHDPSCDVDADAADVVTRDFDFAGMDAGTDVDANRP
jgi:hypothetical protein